MDGKKRLQTTYKSLVQAPTLIHKILMEEQKKAEMKKKRGKLGGIGSDIVGEDLTKLKVFNGNFLTKLGQAITSSKQLQRALTGRGIIFTKVLTNGARMW